MVVMQRPNKLIADVNIGAQMLADKCKESGVASVWVGGGGVESLTCFPASVWVCGYLGVEDLTYFPAPVSVWVCVYRGCKI